MSKESEGQEEGGSGTPSVPGDENPEWIAVKLERIKERIDLMRWSQRVDEDPPRTGSLASVFWNHDVPWLLERASRD